MQRQYQRLTDPQWDVVGQFLPLHRKLYHQLRQMVDAFCLRMSQAEIPDKDQHSKKQDLTAISTT
jgi:hypothetical protein